MRNILFIVVSLLSLVSANALTTNRPMANFDYVSNLRATNRFIVNDPAATGGSGQVPLSVLAAYMATNPAPNEAAYYGAVGDGVTDDTAALQKALDYQASATNFAGIVHVAPGVYKISSPLKIPYCVTFKGSGRNNTIISNVTANCDSITTKKGTLHYTTEHPQFGISDMTIVGQYAATAGAGISNLGDNSGDGGGIWPIIERVSTINHYNGILLSNTVFGSFEDVTIQRPSLGGFVSKGTCNNVTLRNVYVIGTGAYGFESQWATQANGFDVYSGANITGIGCAAEGINGIAYMLGHPTSTRLGSLSRSTFIDCATEVFKNTGFYLQDCDGISLINCNAASTTGTNCMTIAGGSGITLQNFTGGQQLGYTILTTNGTAGTMPTYLTLFGNYAQYSVYPQKYSHPELFNLAPSYGATVNVNSNCNHYQNLAGYNAISNETGTKKISLPVYSWPTRMVVTIKGYDLYDMTGAWTATVGLYQSASTPTVNTPSVSISGNPPFSSVRVGIENGKTVILLGTTATQWRYTTLTVSDLIYAGNPVSGYDSGWNITNVTDESGITGISTSAIPTVTPVRIIGTNAPSATPTGIGYLYIDTANKNTYISVGTSIVADWVKLN